MNPSGGRGPGPGRAHLRVADRGGERGALGGERLDLGEVVRARLARARERALLEPPRREERVPARCEIVPHRARLGRPGRDDRDARRGESTGVGGRAPLLCGPPLRSLHLLGDPPVLESDALEKLVVVDQVVEAGGGDEEREDVRRVLDVDRADTRLEDRDGLGVLRLQVLQTNGLCAQACGQALQPGLLGRELRFELPESALGLVDRRLGRLELRDDGRELRGEDALALLRCVDLRLQRRDPCVHGRLLVDVVARRGSGEGERGGERAQGQGTPTHQPLGSPTLRTSLRARHRFGRAPVPLEGLERARSLAPERPHL